MTNWEIANELYKAKKSYDSICFIKENESHIIQPTKYLNEQLNIFFIQLCTVIDKCFSGNIEQLKHTDNIVEKIKYERNKHSAHTDDLYDNLHTPKDVESLKSYITHIYQLAKLYLPTTFTLDFICYDKSLYRQINNITPDIEKKLPIVDYYLSDNKVGKIPNISEGHLYVDEYGALHIQSGITRAECIQNIQDFIMYCHVNYYNLNDDTWFNAQMIIERKFEK